MDDATHTETVRTADRHAYRSAMLASQLTMVRLEILDFAEDLVRRGQSGPAMELFRKVRRLREEHAAIEARL